MTLKVIIIYSSKNLMAIRWLENGQRPVHSKMINRKNRCQKKLGNIRPGWQQKITGMGTQEWFSHCLSIWNQKRFSDYIFIKDKNEINSFVGFSIMSQWLKVNIYIYS